MAALASRAGTVRPFEKVTALPVVTSVVSTDSGDAGLFETLDRHDVTQEPGEMLVAEQVVAFAQYRGGDAGEVEGNT